jgi:Ser/Thr protein kinase RdoA (MazF antagonist)
MTPILGVPRPARMIESARARLRRPDIARETVQEIMGLYGLALSGPPRNLSASRRNHNVVVATPAGRWLLKRYRPQWQSETVSYCHSIIAELASRGFPVPRLAVARDGHDYVGVGGHHYALIEFVDGSSYSANFLLRSDRRRLMAMAGTTMARLHKTLQGFVPHGCHHLGFAEYSGGRRRDITWYHSKVRELLERSARLDHTEDQASADWLIPWGSPLVEQLAPLDKLLHDAPLTRTVIHGDYGLHNLLFGKDGTVIPIDFELARLEWRLSDLVSCLSRLRYAGGAYDFQSIRWFLTAYDAEYPLSDDEWRLFPEVWRFYKLQGAVQYWGSYFETGGPRRKLLAARDALEQAAMVARDPAGLLAQLRGSPAGDER